MKRAARKIIRSIWKLEADKELKSVLENKCLLEPDGKNNIAHGNGLGDLEPTRDGPVG